MVATPTSPPGLPIHPLRILYADELREMRVLVRLILSPLGHWLECLENGKLAWERIRAEPGAFDLVITDHHMPVLNGLEFVRLLRTVPFAGRIIVFSSDLDPRTASAYLSPKVDQILNKPVQPDVLRRIIAELFPRAG